MIDKCTAERNAVTLAYGNANIRLCQFHAIQAIGRFKDKDTEKLSNWLINIR